VPDPATHMLAAKAPAGAASDLINVAFRTEPARIWMDENQAFALHDGNIDKFLARIDLGALTGGATQTFQQRPGYYERIYEDDTTPVNTETMDGSYFQDVSRDVRAHYRVDPNRVDLAGHSMGGWASYLLGLLFPDRWAASNPEDGLLVPGLWTGFSPPSDPQDGADINAEFLAPLIGNARNLPYAILHGTVDELVPVGSALKPGLMFQ